MPVWDFIRDKIIYILCFHSVIIGQDVKNKKYISLLFSLTKEAFIAWLTHLNTILSLPTIDYLESYISAKLYNNSQ